MNTNKSEPLKLFFCRKIPHVDNSMVPDLLFEPLPFSLAIPFNSLIGRESLEIIFNCD